MLTIRETSKHERHKPTGKFLKEGPTSQKEKRMKRAPNERKHDMFRK